MSSPDLSPSPVDCDAPLHPSALVGLRLFNQRHFWHAHEALERAWIEEPGQIRELYRGILQAGVAYLHIERGNYNGALKVSQRCQHWLSPFPEICRGIPIGQLRCDLAAAMQEVERLGSKNLADFDQSFYKPIFYQE